MNKKTLWIGAAFLCLAGVATGLVLLEPAAEFNQEQPIPLRPVTVQSVRPGPNAGTVSVFGQVAPRWQVELRARVSGQVSGSEPVALAGTRFSKGDILLKLEDTPYQANLADARSTLENARFDLRKKQNKHTIALKDWVAVNPNRPAPEMAVHLPEMGVAEQAVGAAEARVVAAEHDLKSTYIRAPFSGIVTKRHVSLGASVNAGDVLFTILDDSLLDLQVSVAPGEWALLDRNWQNVSVEVLSEQNRIIGTARIREAGGFLDPQSRRYQLFLEITGPADASLVPGIFVRVRLPGLSLDNTLRVPESALTQDGFVWFLDPENRLQRFAASALFRDAGEVIVGLPDDISEDAGEEAGLRIIPMPMSSFLPGKPVLPVLQETPR